MQFKEDATTLLYIGEDLRRQGNYSKSGLKYTRAIQKTPDNVLLYHNWAHVLKYLKKYKEAEDKYSKIIKIRPFDSLAYAQWGQLLDFQEKHQEAETKYAKAVQFAPHQFSLYWQWGSVLLNQYKYKEAAEKYQQAIKINGSYCHPYFYSSLALFCMNKPVEGKVICLQALNLLRDAPLNRLNWLKKIDTQAKETKNKISSTLDEIELRNLKNKYEGIRQMLAIMDEEINKKAPKP